MTGNLKQYILYQYITLLANTRRLICVPFLYTIMGNAARTIQSAIRARLLDSMTLPVRAFSELPPEVEDPAQFHFNRADWKIIPRDIQQHLVRRITDSNDPAGLNLRAMIRALAESIKRGGRLPLYLLRRKKPRFGDLNSNKSLCFILVSNCRE